MLSFTQGTPIAAICGGPLDKKVLRLAQEADEPDRSLEEEDPYELLDEEDFAAEQGSKRLLSTSMQHRLRRALRDEEEPDDADLASHYRRALLKVSERLKKELSLPCGTMFVLPADKPERVYIAGKSGAGKSCVAACYMNEYHRLFPHNRIFLISRHEDEPAYRRIPHEAVPLELFEGREEKKGHRSSEPSAPPLELEQLRDSLVVFDDMDNCPSKEISAAVTRLCNSVISNGRKYGIHSCWLNHQVTDWSKTRNLIMEANKIVVFPSGDNYHITNFLKRYAGLGGATIKKILGVRSRWVMLATTTPNYIVHEHGAFVL